MRPEERRALKLAVDAAVRRRFRYQLSRGRRRSKAEIRETVLAELHLDPTRADRTIGNAAGVGEQTVAKIRAGLAG